MNQRTRLKREIIRRRRHSPWPEIFTRITAPNGLRIRVEIRTCTCALGHLAHADYQAGDVARVHASWPPTLEVFRELNHWVSVRCWWCMDYGLIEIFHPSTDALIGHQKCPRLGHPKYHPPRTPVPLQVVTGPAHLPGCTGEDPWCCPPF